MAAATTFGELLERHRGIVLKVAADVAEARKLEDSWGGQQLLNVQRFLDELAAFARE